MAGSAYFRRRRIFRLELPEGLQPAGQLPMRHAQELAEGPAGLAGQDEHGLAGRVRAQDKKSR